MLPYNFQKKYIDRFNVLVEQGEKITVNNNENIAKDKGILAISPLAKQWQTNCITLLSHVLQGSNTHSQLIEEFHSVRLSTFNLNNNIHISEAVGKLKAIKDDFENGFLANLSMQIEAEIAADYMGQAEKLLDECKNDTYDHIPAAVLTGTVLEKSLRTLCDQQNPPILTFKTTTKGKSEPLTLNPLIDELKKAAVFNELKAKQLRFWADIRNAAAHGEFDKFSRSDVEQMIEGVKNFLATYIL